MPRWFHPATGYSFPMAVAVLPTRFPAYRSAKPSGNTITLATSSTRNRSASPRASNTQPLYATIPEVACLFCFWSSRQLAIRIFRAFFIALCRAPRVARFYAPSVFTFGDALRIRRRDTTGAGYDRSGWPESFWRASSIVVSRIARTHSQPRWRTTFPLSTRPERASS